MTPSTRSSFIRSEFAPSLAGLVEFDHPVRLGVGEQSPMVNLVVTVRYKSENEV